jgi:hypothetical protein
MRIVRTLGLASALLLLGSTVAQAGTHDQYSPDGGSNVYSYSPNDYFAVADVKGDGHWVYGFWIVEDSGHRRNNKGGYGTVLISGTSATVTRVKACTEYMWSPDSCSSWG